MVGRQYRQLQLKDRVTVTLRVTRLQRVNIVACAGYVLIDRYARVVGPCIYGINRIQTNRVGLQIVSGRIDGELMRYRTIASMDCMVGIVSVKAVGHLAIRHTNTRFTTRFQR